MLKDLASALRARWPFALVLIVTGLLQGAIAWSAVERSAARGFLAETVIAALGAGQRGTATDALDRAEAEAMLAGLAAQDGVVEAAVVDGGSRIVADLYGRWSLESARLARLHAPASLVAGLRAGLPRTRISRAGGRYLVAVPVRAAEGAGPRDIVVERESRAVARVLAGTAPWVVGAVIAASLAATLAVLALGLRDVRRGTARRSGLATAVIALLFAEAIAAAVLFPLLGRFARDDAPRVAAAISSVVAEIWTAQPDEPSRPLAAALTRILTHVAAIEGVFVTDPLGRAVVRLADRAGGDPGSDAVEVRSSLMSPETSVTAPIGAARYAFDALWSTAPAVALARDMALLTGTAALVLVALALARARDAIGPAVPADPPLIGTWRRPRETLIACLVGLGTGLLIGDALFSAEAAGERLALSLALAVALAGGGVGLAATTRAAERRGWRPPTLAAALAALALVLVFPLQLGFAAAALRAALVLAAALALLAGLQARLLMRDAGRGAALRLWTAAATGLIAGPALASLTADLLGLTASVVIASAALMAATAGLLALPADRAAPLRLLVRPAGPVQIRRTSAAGALAARVPLRAAASVGLLLFAGPALLSGDRSGASMLAAGLLLFAVTALASARLAPGRLGRPAMIKLSLVTLLAAVLAPLAAPNPLGFALMAGLTGLTAGTIAAPWILLATMRSHLTLARGRLGAIGGDQAARLSVLAGLLLVIGGVTAALGAKAALASAGLLAVVAAISYLRPQFPFGSAARRPLQRR